MLYLVKNNFIWFNFQVFLISKSIISRFVEFVPRTFVLQSLHNYEFPWRRINLIKLTVVVRANFYHRELRHSVLSWPFFLNRHKFIYILGIVLGQIAGGRKDVRWQVEADRMWIYFPERRSRLAIGFPCASRRRWLSPDIDFTRSDPDRTLHDTPSYNYSTIWEPRDCYLATFIEHFTLDEGILCTPIWYGRQGRLLCSKSVAILENIFFIHDHAFQTFFISNNMQNFVCILEIKYRFN